MAWTAWVYKAGIPGGSLETLTDYCESVRIDPETAAGRRGSNPVVQYRHGEYSTPRKYVRAANLSLETVIRYTNSAGAVTHADGAPGHIMENWAHLKRIFGAQQGTLCRLQRTAPDYGDVYRDVELLADVKPSQARHIMSWPLHSPHPFWIGAADTGNTGATLTVAGDAPIGDAVITLTGGTDGGIVHTNSGASVEISGAMPAGGVIVDVGAGTCVKVTGGADYSNFLVVNKPWWFELDSGANAVTNTGGTSHSVDWITQWR